jgi:hypothetical protein
MNIAYILESRNEGRVKVVSVSVALLLEADTFNIYMLSGRYCRNEIN